MIEWRHESIFTGPERASASRTRRRIAARAPGCKTGGLLSDVGKQTRGQGQPEYDEPGNQATGLYAKKKRLGATERKEAERTAWREQMSGVDANQVGTVNETGSNIGLTPLGARRA